MTYTKQDVIEATKELQDAMIQWLEARENTVKAQVRETKARQRVLMAKDVIRSLEVY